MWYLLVSYVIITMIMFALQVLLQFSLHVYKGVEGDSCFPCSCYCDWGVFVEYLPKHLLCVDCSWKNLASVPSFPANITMNIGILILYNNRITTLESGAFSNYSNLQWLHLHRNEIFDIAEGAFDGLKTLQQLELDNNRIKTLPRYPFRHLENLLQLRLAYNEISLLQDGSFVGLRRLKALDLGHNQITNISAVAFDDLVKLETLFLESNQIQVLQSNMFRQLEMLKMLSLSSNKISEIQKDTFQGLQNLASLSLIENKITKVSSDVLNGLSKLEVLDLSGNLIQSIPHSTFRHLEMLTSLALRDNRLVEIQKNALNGLQRLKYLHLYGNTLTNIYVDTFDGLLDLGQLYLQNNTITSISEKAFIGLTKMKVLFLNNNRIEKLQQDTFKGMLSLAVLNLTENKISHAHQKVFFPLGNLFHLFLQNNNFKDVPSALWTTRLPPSHVSVYLDNNPFICSCKLINELKQLRHKVKKLQPSTSHYEQECINITSMCEEQRNFALAMNVGQNCPASNYDFLNYMNRFESEYTFTDGNNNTYGSCEELDLCRFSVRIDLPGIIVVTNVIIVIQFDVEIGGSITFEVGDKLSDIYEPCNKFALTPSSSYGKKSIEVLCGATPSGRDVRVNVNVSYQMEGPYKSSNCDTLIKVYEIVVNGYEKNKYNLWSEWNEWGTCSTTCGNGLRRRNRTCTNSTSLNCVLPGYANQRSSIDITEETCNLEPCFQAVYQWTIGGVGGVFVLTVFGIVFWYRKFKMIRYFDGLRPNPNFELDPNKTLLEQIEELPYDLHWEFPRYDVRFGSIIGEGNFGRVWLAKAKGIRAFNPRDHSDLSSRAKLAKLQDQRVHEYFTTVTESWLLGDCDTTHHYDVAVKTLKECATPKHQMDLASELKLLIYMDRHPNIVNVLASCTIRGDLWVIMEYCDHGSLKRFLSDRRKLFIPSWSKNSVDMSSEICFFDLLQMTEQIVNGVMFLHCWKVVHRDLSARNILVDANFNLKIADFGLARSENFIAPSDDILPIKWSSLESLLRHEYTTKSDIWSVAVLFWEVFSFGEVPYPGMSSKEVIQQLKEGYRMSAPDHCPEEIWNIISDSWSADPEQRPSAMELFEKLDEIKVSVCSAPDGQYYGASGGNYGQAGTVQGPSLDDIIEGKENTGFEYEESQTSASVHKTLTEDGDDKGRPSTIAYKQYCKLENENYRLRTDNQQLKINEEKIKFLIGTKIQDPHIIVYEQYRKLENDIYRLGNDNQHVKKIKEEVKAVIRTMEIFDKRFKEIKQILMCNTENNIEARNNSLTESGKTETLGDMGDTDTVDNSHVVVCMDTIDSINLQIDDIEVDASDDGDTVKESCV